MAPSLAMPVWHHPSWRRFRQKAWAIVWTALLVAIAAGTMAGVMKATHSHAGGEQDHGASYNGTYSPADGPPTHQGMLPRQVYDALPGTTPTSQPSCRAAAAGQKPELLLLAPAWLAEPLHAAHHAPAAFSHLRRKQLADFMPSRAMAAAPPMAPAASASGGLPRHSRGSRARAARCSAKQAAADAAGSDWRAWRRLYPAAAAPAAGNAAAAVPGRRRAPRCLCVPGAGSRWAH